MKSYTDLEQSKKLEEMLPLESADMIYTPMMDIDSMSNSGFFNIPECYSFNEFKDSDTKPLPCWSLAALLDLLPNNEHIETNISRGAWKLDTVEYVPNTWWCEYEDNKNQTKFSISADNPIDVCVDMIIKLNEQKLL